MPLDSHDIAKAKSLVEDERSIRYAATIRVAYTTVQPSFNLEKPIHTQEDLNQADQEQQLTGF